MRGENRSLLLSAFHKAQPHQLPGFLWAGFIMSAFQGSIRAMVERIINLKIETLSEGGYLATSDDLPGLVAQGRTIAECIEIAQDVARKLIESFLERRDPLPPKLTSAAPSEIEVGIPVSVP